MFNHSLEQYGIRYNQVGAAVEAASLGQQPQRDSLNQMLSSGTGGSLYQNREKASGEKSSTGVDRRLKHSGSGKKGSNKKKGKQLNTLKNNNNSRAFKDSFVGTFNSKSTNHQTESQHGHFQVQKNSESIQFFNMNMDLDRLNAHQSKGLRLVQGQAYGGGLCAPSRSDHAQTLYANPHNHNNILGNHTANHADHHASYHVMLHQGSKGIQY